MYFRKADSVVSCEVFSKEVDNKVTGPRPGREEEPQEFDDLGPRLSVVDTTGEKIVIKCLSSIKFTEPSLGFRGN